MVAPDVAIAQQSRPPPIQLVSVRGGIAAELSDVTQLFTHHWLRSDVVRRYSISHTEGATFGPHPTVEDIAGNWELIRDGSLPNELDGEAMAWGVKAYSTRLQDLSAQLQDAEVIR
jgi:hypothetical protein